MFAVHITQSSFIADAQGHWYDCPLAASAPVSQLLTCIPNREASKLAGGKVLICTTLNQRSKQAVAVQGSVEVCRVAAHVAQQVADTCPHCWLCMTQQLAQLRVGGSLGQGDVVVSMQPC